MTPETNWTSGNGQRPRLKEGAQATPRRLGCCLHPFIVACDE
jgi:hypothetical protein